MNSIRREKLAQRITDGLLNLWDEHADAILVVAVLAIALIYAAKVT